MERDFLGLSSRNDMEEALNESKNQVSLGGSSARWPFSNRVVAVPHLLSFKAAEDGRVRNTVAQPASNSSQRPIYGACQVITNIRQQTQGISFAGPFTGHPLPSSSLKTIFRSPSKSSISPQLTIFYDGSVKVYDDISPESAQAVMLLAANGSSKSENNPSFTSQLRVQSQCHTSGCPDLLHPNFRQHVKVGGSSCPIGFTAINPPATLETMKPGTPVRSSPPHGSLVPQARKASLARFLEKRKERKLNASPYNFPESECSSSSYIVDRSGTRPLPAHS